MSHIDNFIMMGMGGLFILLSIICFLWARSEERGINNALSQRRDLREFLTRWPPSIEPGALRLGGWIMIAIGIVLIILGGAFLAIE
jgi:hypothetical protein